MSSSLGAREGPGGKHEPDGMTHRSKDLEKRSMNEAVHEDEQDCLFLMAPGSVYRRQTKGSLPQGADQLGDMETTSSRRVNRADVLDGCARASW